MIGLPPLLVGAVHVTLAVLFPPVAVAPVGADGAESAVGVTALDAADAALGPMALLAVTVKVYVVPGVRLLIVADVEGGEPLIVVVGWAAAPMYGVTV